MENIEKLFKETFEHFEADVNPNVWANVQSGMGSSVGSAASTAAKFAIGKIIAGAATVAVVAGSVWYFSSDNNKKINSTSSNNNHTQTETVSKKTAQNVISETQSPNSFSNSQTNKQTASINHSANQNLVNNSQTAENNSAISENETAAENSNSQPAHKYGNASQGDGGMMRGNKFSSSSSSNNAVSNSSSDSQDEDASMPTANIFVSTTSGDAPLTVEFINQGIASTLSWDFGDGSSSRENFPSHTFDKAGSYVVTLNAKNTAGGVSDKVTIEVKPISSIENAPNIFTPNGDGENDIFFFEMKNIASIGVAVYSQKTGEQVAKWNSLDGNWNGKLFNGTNASDGVYFYSIQAIGTDGLSHSETGFVTLKR